MGVVLITGCRSGIGLATALAFGRRGHRVFATMRDEANGDHLTELARRERLPITVSSLDVTDRDAVNATVDTIVTAEGGVDILVNNAGVPGPLAAIEEVDEALGRAVMEANFWGPFRLARAVLPHMRTRRSGVIINVSTFGVRLGGGARALFFYNVSKHALYQLSLSLQAELASTGVRVIDIEPGAFATGIYDETKRPTIDPSSPYAPMLRELDGILANMIATGASPDIVADAIVSAANDPASPRCVLVGHDAIAAVKAYQHTQTQAWASVAQRPGRSSNCTSSGRGLPSERAARPPRAASHRSGSGSRVRPAPDARCSSMRSTPTPAIVFPCEATATHGERLRQSNANGARRGWCPALRRRVPTRASHLAHAIPPADG